MCNDIGDFERKSGSLKIIGYILLDTYYLHKKVFTEDWDCAHKPFFKVLEFNSYKKN